MENVKRKKKIKKMKYKVTESREYCTHMDMWRDIISKGQQPDVREFSLTSELRENT